MTNTKHFKTVLEKRRAYLEGKSDEIEDSFEKSGDEPFDGDCVTCGDPVTPERLDVLPHTPFCKDHA